MCGIIAGVTQSEQIAPILLAGLKRLEYRGYDSAGLAVLNQAGQLASLRVCGKVQQLVQAHAKAPLTGQVGIAHTRWATHGQPNESNAHPHLYENKIALVHNGIIENYLSLRHILEQQQVKFISETDSEIIVQWLGLQLEKTQDLLAAVQATVQTLSGAYALAVVAQSAPDRIIAARQGSPLVIGIGEAAHFIASDSLALLPFTQAFVVLEEGDIAEIFYDHFVIYDQTQQVVRRSVRKMNVVEQSTDRGTYRHFMQKEIFEQPAAIRSALAGRLFENEVPDAIFGAQAQACFDQTQAVQLLQWRRGRLGYDRTR